MIHKRKQCGMFALIILAELVLRKLLTNYERDYGFGHGVIPLRMGGWWKDEYFGIENMAIIDDKSRNSEEWDWRVLDSGCWGLGTKESIWEAWWKRKKKTVTKAVWCRVNELGAKMVCLGWRKQINGSWLRIAGVDLDVDWITRWRFVLEIQLYWKGRNVCFWTLLPQCDLL